MNHCFELENLSFFYPEQEKEALGGIHFAVPQGEFVTLCGPSGCGKSTLLRQLKPALAPHGIRRGHIRFLGRPLEEVSRREQAASIGFVQQSPENQIATDKVWHELAFGLESLGYDTPTIRGRVAETASFFGISPWFHQDVSALSGGQKQLLNLASVMVMQPSVLLLDEPTSQLDPIAASEFLAAVCKINRELGTTVILSEHRLEEALPLSHRVLVMDEGQIIADGPPRDVGRRLKEQGHAMFLAMPTPMRIWAALPGGLPCPITPGEGRDFLARFAAGRPPVPMTPPPAAAKPTGDAALSLENVWFRYDKNGPDVLKGLSLTVHKGEFMAVLGGNGTGKSTMLSVASGLQQAYRGSVAQTGKIGMLPQDPQTLFVKKTLREDLFEVFRGLPVSPEKQAAGVARVSSLCRLNSLLERHPYDLSGGEQQRAALAKILLLEPEILLLDEPTKGLDAGFKQVLAGILNALLRKGVAVLMVSHDVEFCGAHAHRCGLFFDGGIVTEGPPHAFFPGNRFYTTCASRMARDVLPRAVTAGDVIEAFGGSVPPKAAMSDETAAPLPPAPSGGGKRGGQALPLWRKILAGGAGAVAAASFVKAVRGTDFSALLSPAGLTSLSRDSLVLYAVLIAALLLLALATAKGSPPAARPVSVPKERRRLPKRTAAAALVILLLIPLTIFLGFSYLGGKRYYFTALLILLETMLPFFLVFEGRRPQARELVMIAALCALGVAGRAAFFMLPSFKPVLALVIVSGVALGGETGFLVGAMTMLSSNVLFGQGPWTPFQMVAAGLVGFLAGVLFRKGLLRRTRLSLCVFGGLSAIVLYGGIMNPASALIWAHTINWEMLLSYTISGLPMDLIHAFSTVLILWFAAEPMLEKLDRIKVKYGLVS
ncbi:MAG: ATP-binding cassette domain-containing protein [Oscillospiraceae bacterium]